MPTAVGEDNLGAEVGGGHAMNKSPVRSPHSYPVGHVLGAQSETQAMCPRLGSLFISERRLQVQKYLLTDLSFWKFGAHCGTGERKENRGTGTQSPAPARTPASGSWFHVPMGRAGS